MKNGSNSTAILAERGIILMFFGGGCGDKYCETVSVRKMAKLTMTFNQFFLGLFLYGSLGMGCFSFMVYKKLFQVAQLQPERFKF